MLAERYAGNPTVIGADLHNEPHGGTWGDGGADRLAAAAERAGNAILAVNPNWLIVVEGVGSLSGPELLVGRQPDGRAATGPSSSTCANKLVYSPHDYPELGLRPAVVRGRQLPANLPAKFDQMWGYLYKQGIAPVSRRVRHQAHDPKDAPWLEAITSYLAGDLDSNGTPDIPAGKQGVSWTYWSWNPNSGDTGGILAGRLDTA